MDNIDKNERETIKNIGPKQNKLILAPINNILTTLSVYYMCNVYIEIADHLKIKIFRITPQVTTTSEKQAAAASKLQASTGVRTRSQVKKSD